MLDCKVILSETNYISQRSRRTPCRSDLAALLLERTSWHTELFENVIKFIRSTKSISTIEIDTSHISFSDKRTIICFCSYIVLVQEIGYKVS